ncbi:MAG TPA: hypothetical protein VFM59_00490 [Salinimicrobium sp.]|nr:hypothetical protein [Salinimicrobium sp.]
MRKIAFLSLLLVITSCKSKKVTTTDDSDKFLIENLADAASAEKLKSTYPDANINEGISMFEEATVERAFTILYPETPNEVLITWKDLQRTEPHHIRIAKNGHGVSKNGIKVGTSYDELVEINGGPISFYGFGWDYGGAVDWEDGKMENTKIRVFLAPKGEVQNKYYGDHIVEASKEEIDSMQLAVQTILYQEPD